jgi:phage baseplate assembly protein W
MPLPANSVPTTMQHARLGAFPNGSAYAGRYTLLFRLRDRNQPARLLKEHALVLMPTTFTQRTDARTAGYYTQDAYHIDHPSGNAVGRTVFFITGHTGYRGVVQDSSNPLLNQLDVVPTIDRFVATVRAVVSQIGLGGLPQSSLIDGAAAIKDLQDLFRMYLNPAEGLETAGIAETQDLQLEFINLTEPVSAEDPAGRMGWEIDVEQSLVDLRQDAQKPWLYTYSLQFTGLRPLPQVLLDPWAILFEDRQLTFRDILRRINAVVQDLTNSVNTIRYAFQQLVIQNITGPLSTFLINTAQLSDAIEGVATGVAQFIQWPLYAQRLITNPLEVAIHSVSTLKDAALQLAGMLTVASLARTFGIPLGGTSLTSGVNDHLTVQLNHETPVTLVLGTQSSGASIAATIQAQMRAQTPEHAANEEGYRAFQATYTEGSYILTSGTQLSEAAHVAVLVDADSALTPTDASATLGLGLANGGHEQRGQTVAVRAIALLEDLAVACTRLLATPEVFAAQLAEQDARLAAQYPVETVRTALQGEQYLTPVRLTPGETLQAVGARVGVPWETLALVNHLTFPYVLQEPQEILRGRATSADRYHLTDSTATWTPNAYQGKRLDLLSGAGAGQSRLVLRNTATELLIDVAWGVQPNDTTDYSLREAANPIRQTGTLTSVTSQTVTQSALRLVPDSQAGLTLRLATGAAAGDERRIVTHDATTYLLDRPWAALPAPGDTYLILSMLRAGLLRQRLVGDMLSVPRPSHRRPRTTGLRGLEDVATITGQVRTREEKIFGRDLLLTQGTLLWDPVQQDAVTIAGVPNLRQAVIHLINLPLGQLPSHPQVGSYLQQELGRAATVTSQLQLAHSVQRTLLQDARVAALTRTELVTEGGHTLLSLDVRAVSGETLDRVVIR